MPSAAQWRLYVTSSPMGGISTQLANLELRGSVGGADLCSGGTVTTSGDRPEFPSTNLFDHDPDTFWSSSFYALPCWVGYEFAAPQAIAEYAMQARASAGEEPTDFELQYYSGSEWVAADSRTGETWTAGEWKVFSWGSPAPSARPVLFVVS